MGINPGKATAILLFSIILINNKYAISQPATPAGLEARGFDSHIELAWNTSPEPDLAGYRVYFTDDTLSEFQFLARLNANQNSFIHFTGRSDQVLFYRIKAYDNTNAESDWSSMVMASTFEMNDEELLTMVQEYTFRYFWDFAHPVSGLARERNTTSTVTSGGSGFGIMAILVGIERGFISREQGLERMVKIVNFLGDKADRFKGVWSHWLNGATGKVIPFSTKDNGGDLVETSFLLQGLLTARQYFGGENEQERQLRNKITTLWEDVDWNWYRKQNQNVLFWHWSPQYNFEINFELRGYFEALITYILAVASPTHGIPANVYHKGWAGRPNYVNGNSYYGYKLFVGPAKGGPLFFSHYSFLGFDPRNIKDDYANYFIQNINHAYVNQAHCIENPGKYLGYSDICWGLTASDDPIRGYLAHDPNQDNGTITPTAALSSMPYVPEISINTMKHFYRDHGARLWGKYGFYDAFNLSRDWFADSYLAIDQGPIICMIENYRSELLWNYFMSNPEIQTALDKIGFVPDSTLVTGTEGIADSRPLSIDVFPNPILVSDPFFVELNEEIPKKITLFNIRGQEWVLPEVQPSGIIPAQLGLVPGIYYLKIDFFDSFITKKILILN